MIYIADLDWPSAYKLKIVWYAYHVRNEPSLPTGMCNPLVISDNEFKSHTSTYMYSATQGDGMWDIGWGWPLIMMPHPHNLILQHCANTSNSTCTTKIDYLLYKYLLYQSSEKLKEIGCCWIMHFLSIICLGCCHEHKCSC